MALHTRIQVAHLMSSTGMVPLFYHSDVEVAKSIALACYKGGARLLEFTNRGDFAHEVFGALRKFCAVECPELALGVGSVTDAAAASLYMMLGADFVVTPVLREDIAVVCNRRKVMWNPGCASLAEICRAEELGAEVVKLFPGSVYGAGFVKGILGPQPWTSIMPTGGVSPDRENLTAWFDAGVVCVGMGSKLISKQLIASGDWAVLEQKTRETLALIEEIRG
ncbi:MAG: bifunctional 4-hydroxy-2-oxoglutarate aldolase/2-dehydro-3-deoxy-phosphogluconate aldolase [Saprospiraceae bacterium]